MTTDSPLLSVVVPTYNRSHLIGQALSTVLDQAFGSFEVIVVNDGSSDDTSQVLETMNHPRLRVVEKPNGGLSSARNAGAAVARGQFVTFLDDDDEAEPGWLSAFAQLVASPSVGVAWCGAILERGGDPGIDVVPVPMAACFDRHSGVMLPGTFAVERGAFRAVGGFLEGLPSSELSEFMLRLLPYCTDHHLRVATTDAALVRIHQQDPGLRPLRSPDVLAEALTTVIGLHRDRLRLAPQYLANCYAVAGVSFARCHDYRSARRNLVSAVRTRPRDLRNVQRLAVAMVPPLADRIWKTGRGSGSAGEPALS